ncbi:MAG TPA: VWA domain-containing protein [Blastocatellia bacterium]|nr:VWA domain-containing protein [Blastocatellia bacterium]
MLTRHRRPPIVAFLITLMLFGFSIALSQSETQKPDQRPMVRLNVLVSDGQSRQIRDLLKEDLIIKDEGELQNITYLALEENPISYGILIDTSNSLRPFSQVETGIAQTIINTNNAGDRTFVMKFSGRKDIQIAQDWTDDKILLRNASGGFRGNGETAITDAMYLAADHIEKQMQSDNNARRRYAVILISDGDDTEGAVSESKLVSRLRDLDIQIFIVCLLNRSQNQGSTPEFPFGKTFVNHLTKTTGGLAFYATTINEVQSACNNLISFMRRQYVVGYYPTKLLGAGKYHRVTAQLTGRTHKKDSQVSVRTGYDEPAN